MEETIRALQAGMSRLDHGDFNWNLFPGMRLPLKIKIPDFKRYDGTKDPSHHLRHYQRKMLQYWDYEEFIIQTFQDSLMGPALDWFMTLKAQDISTWADLSQKFLDQYRFCAETPPTLLKLSTMEMKENQAFEAYATEWRGKAAKHIPPISEIQQKEGEAPRKQAAGTSRRTKDATISAVNPGHQPQKQFSVNYAPAPSAPQAYARPVHYLPPYQPQQTHYSAPPFVILPQLPQQQALVQSRAPASRPPQPAQRTPAPQTRQGNATPS
ncbi:hypothetical protein CRG98_019960 [Punica granatum]|uniref:Retrotransposon gag domain-containing protein n=1 Tax=Punica granatum TaxID=22663 RepID=A0A2I0JTM7_PUNGR|nr:hypothetical protein CRG98_019960 [Punica granatum]